MNSENLRSFFLLTLINVLILSTLTSCQSADREKTNKDKTVKAKELLKSLAEGKNVALENKTITGNLDFTTLSSYQVLPGTKNISVEGSLTFSNCIFKGKVLAFAKSDKHSTFLNFQKNISFINSTFEDEVNLREADINGSLRLDRSAFRKKCTLEGLRVRGRKASFSEASFLEELRLQRFRCDGDLFFTKALVQGICSFQRMLVIGDAQFASVRFNNYTDFSNASFRGECLMNYSKFGDKLQLIGGRFDDRFEMLSCEFSKEVQVKKSVFRGTVSFEKAVFSESWSVQKCSFSEGTPALKGVKADKTVFTENMLAGKALEIKLQSSDSKK